MQESFSSTKIEIVLLLLIVVAVLVTIAQRINVSYPLLLVLCGPVLSFVPGLPRVELNPEIVFLLFLPPLLYVSGLFTSFRDFRAALVPISLNAFGLALATTGVVALVAHALISRYFGTWIPRSPGSQSKVDVRDHPCFSRHLHKVKYSCTNL